MDILDFFASYRKEWWLTQLKTCEWRAAKLLVELIEQDTFHQVLGEGSLYLMVKGDEIISFLTLTERDCIDDPAKSPWIGFVYTSPRHRGCRYAGRLITHAMRKARAQGHEQVYVCTDHAGLYEQYGFDYVESRMDIYGAMSRVYVQKTEA